ncbi:MAG: glutamate synthase, partial [Betaproteobacteria bacterium]|nr:glutamate synthase [Betaproteobacteria bacterium]
QRDWAIATQALLGNHGRVETLRAVRLTWQGGKMQEIAGSAFDIKADLVLLAMGFTGPTPTGLVAQLSALGVGLDGRGNVAASVNDPDHTTKPLAYQTAHPKIFAAGDMRRGQSLVVWAIREGRQCARAVDTYLMGSSLLPR